MVARAVVAGGAIAAIVSPSGCADWPRLAHLETAEIGPPHALPIEVEDLAVQEGEDWGRNEGRTRDDPVVIDLTTAGTVDARPLTPYEYVRVSGTLDAFGWYECTTTVNEAGRTVCVVPSSDPLVLDCGQDESGSVRGWYHGDIDFVKILTGSLESMCAFVSVSGCESADDEAALDLVAYRMSDPDAVTCDLLEGSFLTLEGGESGAEPAWTSAGKFTPIDVAGSSAVLLYIAGVSGCAGGSASYEVKLVPVRHEGRCVELDTLGF
jgi:hypothetical protein